MNSTGCDLAHNVIGSGRCELPDGHTAAVGLPAARQLTEQALAAAGLSHNALIGAGVSLPGPVRHHPDVVKPSPILPGWPGVTSDDFAAALGVPVSIDNDANLAALGEHIWDAGLAPQRVVLVGAMAEAGEIVLTPIRAALHRNIAPNQPPDLVLGTLGTRHTALGAVALALGESEWVPGMRGAPARVGQPGGWPGTSTDPPARPEAPS